MRSKIKALLSGACVAALTVAPVGFSAGAFSLFTADAAFAGNGNGNGGGGGGNGGGGGGGGGGNGGGGNGGGNGKGGGNGNGNRGGNDTANANDNGNGQVIRNRGNNGNGAVNGNRGGNANRGANANRGGNGNGGGGGRANNPAAAKFEDGMHPSERGNMNGALHANENAILAHIRNGNTNGPVGHMAALAVADVNAQVAQEYLDSEEVRDYREARGILEEDLDTALSDNEFETYEEYEASLVDENGDVIDEDGDGIPDNAISQIDDAQDALDEFDADPENAETAENIEQAEADVEALADAEQAILDYWNKDGDEVEMLEELRDRLDEYEDEVAAEVGVVLPEDDGAPADEGADPVEG